MTKTANWISSVLFVAVLAVCFACCVRQEHAPWSESIRSLKGKLLHLTGTEVIHGVFADDERLIALQLSKDESAVTQAVSALNAFAEQAGEVPCYTMLVPTAAAVYADSIPEGAPNISQTDSVSQIYAALNPNVTTIDLYHTLYTMREDSIFYRTDPRWTVYGAYCAYKTAIKKLGFSAVPYGSYHIRHLKNDYYGALCDTVGRNEIRPDLIDFWEYPSGSSVLLVMTQNEEGISKVSSLYDEDALYSSDPYQFFLGEKNPVTTVYTDVSGKKQLLLIGNSFAYSFLPFLTQHYQKITFVNLECTGLSFGEYADPEGYSQVLFLSDAVSFSDGSFVTD